MSRLKQYLEAAKNNKLKDYLSALEDALEDAENPEAEYNRIYPQLRYEYDIEETDELFDAEDEILAKFENEDDE